MESSLREILHSNTVGLDTISQPPNLPRRNTTDISGIVTNYSDELPTRKRPSSRIKSSYPRKRAIQACQKCRVRRTKCDNARPSCSSCMDLGVQCTYSEGDPSSFDSASLAILEKLNTIEELIRNQSNASQPPIPDFSIEIKPQTSYAQLYSHRSPILDRSQDRQSPSQLSRMNIEAVLSWPVFEDQLPNLNLKSLLNQEDGLPQSSNRAIDLENGEAEVLLQQFLDHVFIFNPILEETKVQRYMRDVQFNGLGWDSTSCLLLLIYAHGSLVNLNNNPDYTDASSHRQSPHFKQAEYFFSAAQKRMGQLICRSGEVEAQCFFLAGVYLMATIRPLEAWKMFVQALACCEAFHGQKSATGTDGDKEQRLRDSIYWTCFKSELELRLELNVSETSIWHLTYPAFFPSPPEDLKSQREMVWYFYLAEIALRRLGNRILNYIYATPPDSTTSGMTEAILGFEQQASDWLRSLPPALHLDSIPEPGAENDLPETLKFILNGHLLDCYEMMYWPFIVEAINTVPRSAETSIPSPDPAAESFLHKALLVCVERIQKNEQGFFYRHHGTWLMLRSCTRSALVLLGASRIDSLQPLMPEGWHDAVLKVVDLLHYWRREGKDIEDRLNLIERMLSFDDATRHHLAGDAGRNARLSHDTLWLNK